ncbi:MAG: Maf family protein [Acidobacteriota bacterium]|nr:Maf family protein [Acidobacteriota bacterium]
MTPTLRLLLASASPRRAEILGALGIPFDLSPADVDETVLPGEPGRAAAARLASAKAAAAVSRHPGAWVLAADTLVLIDGAVLGKPRDDPEAAAMLRRLSGREHVVVTAVSLLRDAGPEIATVEESRVRIAPLDEEEIHWYVATGEPRDKAGAYAVQGLGARFVESVDGSFSNVMGLPARSVYRLLRQAPDPALARLALASAGPSSRTSVRPPPPG